MGVIQNSFNQLLGIGAIATNTVGKEIGAQHQKAIEMSKEANELKNTRKVRQEFFDTVQKINDFEYDRRTKPYRALQRELDSKYKQVKDWQDRRMLLTENSIRETEKFKHGIFGINRAEKEIEQFRKVDKSERTDFENAYNDAKKGGKK